MEIGLLSFRDIDKQRGFVPQDVADGEEEPSPAILWYEAIYDTPFQELTDEDLSRITMNGWNPEYFVVLSLSRLETSTFAGHYYDGELLQNVGTFYEAFLQSNPLLLSRYCRILGSALSRLQTEGQRVDEADCSVLQDGITVFDDARTKLVAVQATLCC